MGKYFGTDGFRGEDAISSLSCEQDRKHWVYFDEISDKILNSIPKQNRGLVRKQLNILDDNFLDYVDYCDCEGAEQIINERQAIKDEDIFPDGCRKGERIKSGLRVYV